jgi:hypothetical protein
MDTLTTTLQSYARAGLNSRTVLTHNPEHTVYTLVTIPNRTQAAFVSLLVRRQGDWIIIERDQNDHTLVQALQAAGIPRTRIILTYAGEPLPTTASRP